MANRIDPTAGPVRMSTNLSVERQTPKTDFGTKVQAGVGQAASAVATAAAIAAPIVPGAGIVSAAVSSVGTLASQMGGGAVGARYSSALNTTLGAGGPVAGAGGLASALSGNTQLGDGSPGAISSGLQGMQNDNMKMMELQMAMQRENTVFTSMSNVLKVRHDTAKNSIGNIR